MRYLLLLFTLLTVVPTIAENTSNVYAFQNATDNARFHTLIGEYRCLVCQNESLADSNAALATDLRQQIYQRVLAGDSDSDIQHYLVARYGDYVLFQPPFSVNTSALWILPFLLLLGGMITLCILIQRRRRLQ